jgi:hypothetical protein
MDLWYPPKDRPQLFEWWRPLTLASRAARARRIAWLIHVDEFTLVGRVDRSSRPAIWVYKHGVSRGELYLDATGQAYRFTRTPNAKGFGRFSACDIRTAVWQAGLPSAVEPVWFERPGAVGVEWGGRTFDGREASDPLAEDQADAAAAKPRRRGHLTIYDGGRPLAG